MNNDNSNYFNSSFDSILTQIEIKGYAIIENAMDPELTQALLHDCQLNIEQFKPAGIGRQQDTHLNNTVRKDKTLWLTGDSPAQTAYLNLLDALKLQINRHFYMGLFDFECHYAIYNKGDFYKKHLDAFKGKSNRVFSSVFYLNTPDHGGELLIYSQDDTQILSTVTPKSGTLVLFESERFPHEVLPAETERYSIAGWFRKNNSSKHFIDPAQ